MVRPRTENLDRDSTNPPDHRAEIGAGGGRPVDRVLIAEDVGNLARSIARLLKTSMTVEICATAEEAEARVAREDWTGGLFDFSLPDGVATNAITRFRTRFTTAPLVVMSGGSASEVSAIALKHGAMFLAKPFNNFDWLDTFRGRASFKRAPSERLLSFHEELQTRCCTVREAQVVEVYCSGKTADEVAVALRISTPTVRAHLKKACERLGVTSVKELLFELGGWRREP